MALIRFNIDPKIDAKYNMNYKTEIQNWLTTHKSTTLPQWLNRNKEIKQWVLNCTQQYTTKNIMENVYILLISNTQPICKYNNPLQFNTYELGYRKGCILGNKCKCVSEHRITSQKLTLIEKYGVSNVNAIPGTVEKRKQTIFKKYGVEVASQSEELKQKRKEKWALKTTEEKHQIQQKTKETNIKKYGVEHHMKLKSQQEKVFLTNLDRYKVKVPLQDPIILQNAAETYHKNDKTEIVKKIKQTLMENYGVSAASRIHLSQNTLEILDDQFKFKDCIKDRTRREVASELNLSEITLIKYAKRYQMQNLFAKDNLSVPEREINEFIQSLGINTISGNRTILNGKEIDILIPELNIAIEHCGLYYHSEESAGRDQTYHYNKYKGCLENNITLITIFGDEWCYKQEQVKQRLTHILNKTSDKIYARKCNVKEITTTEAKLFIDRYHLQGYTAASVKLGLFYNDELVSVMTFRKPRFNKKIEYEIIRFCSSTNIVGGASKLFQFFIKTYNPNSILSYSDNRWGTGNLYLNLGMKKEKETVGYFYTDYNKRYSRTQFQKHKLIKNGHDANLTEKEIMQKSYDKIWDCGQTLWTWYK